MIEPTEVRALRAKINEMRGVLYVDDYGVFLVGVLEAIAEARCGGDPAAYARVALEWDADPQPL